MKQKVRLEYASAIPERPMQPVPVWLQITRWILLAIALIATISTCILFASAISGGGCG